MSERGKKPKTNKHWVQKTNLSLQGKKLLTYCEQNPEQAKHYLKKYAVAENRNPESK